MSGDSGLIIGDERIGDPRTRTTRTYGGRDAKVIRRRDGRIGIVDAHTGEPLGLMVSEGEAAVREANHAELPAIEDDGLNAMRGLALGLFIVLVLLGTGYALFVAGRAYEHSYGSDSRWSRP